MAFEVNHLNQCCLSTLKKIGIYIIQIETENYTKWYWVKKGTGTHIEQTEKQHI